MNAIIANPGHSDIKILTDGTGAIRSDGARAHVCCWCGNAYATAAAARPSAHACEFAD